MEENEKKGIVQKKRAGNSVIAGICLGVFFGMIGAAYASVPLYRLFCQVTGYGGTTQRAETQYADRILDRTVTIRFDANTARELPWKFGPDQREVTVRLGETRQVGYTAQNLSKGSSRARASYNVTPELAGAYFNKVECFCFTDTELKGGETLDMPVVFYVDPDILNEPDLKDIRTITLSYTMFPIDEPEKPVASGSASASGKAPDADMKLGG